MTVFAVYEKHRDLLAAHEVSSKNDGIDYEAIDMFIASRPGHDEAKAREWMVVVADTENKALEMALGTPFGQRVSAPFDAELWDRDRISHEMAQASRDIGRQYPKREPRGSFQQGGYGGFRGQMAAAISKPQVG